MPLGQLPLDDELIDRSRAQGRRAFLTDCEAVVDLGCTMILRTLSFADDPVPARRCCRSPGPGTMIGVQPRSSSGAGFECRRLGLLEYLFDVKAFLGSRRSVLSDLGRIIQSIEAGNSLTDRTFARMGERFPARPSGRTVCGHGMGNSQGPLRFEGGTSLAPGA